MLSVRICCKGRTTLQHDMLRSQRVKAPRLTREWHETAISGPLVRRSRRSLLQALVIPRSDTIVLLVMADVDGNDRISNRRVGVSKRSASDRFSYSTSSQSRSVSDSPKRCSVIASKGVSDEATAYLSNTAMLLNPLSRGKARGCAAGCAKKRSNS
jgi:hypothetical protein